MKEAIEQLIEKYTNEHNRLVSVMEFEKDTLAALHLSGATSIYGKCIGDLETILKQNQ